MQKLLLVILIILLFLLSGCKKHPWKEFEEIESNIPDIGLNADFDINDNGCIAPCDPILRNKSANAVSYTWFLGEGDASNLVNPNKVFDIPGQYTILLYAAAGGQTDSISKTLTINNPDDLPKANFETTNENCLAPCDIFFENTSQNANTYFWSFGDTVTSTEVMPIHQYELPGTYEVKLVAFGANTSDTIAKMIRVEEPITFAKAIGNSDTGEYGGAVVQNNTGGYVVSGRASAKNYLLLTDEQGVFQSDNMFGAGLAYSLKKTNDQGCIVTGFNGDNDNWGYVLKTDALFGPISEFSLSGEGEIFTHAEPLANGQIICSGKIGNPLEGVIVLLDNSFSPETLAINGYEYIEYVIPGNDGGFVFIGRKSDQQKFLAKILWGNNTVSWEHPLVDIQFERLEKSDNILIATSDDSYVVTGYSDIMGGNGMEDAIMIKVSNEGDLIWQKHYGGDANDRGAGAQVTNDNGLILVGRTNSNTNGGYDVFMVKTNADGEVEWETHFGGLLDDYGSSIKQTSDGGYIIVGGTESFSGSSFLKEDVYLIKTASNGKVF